MPLKEEQGCEHVSRRLDGLPNQWPGTLAAKSAVGIASWNARALFCWDVLQNHRKMRTALGVCQQADICGFQETHGSLPNAIEFARLVGGARCFSAWSAVGCDVIDFSLEEFEFGSSGAHGAEEHTVPFGGERDTAGDEKGVQSQSSSVNSDEQSDSGTSSGNVDDCDLDSYVSSSGGVFSVLKREALARRRHASIGPLCQADA